MHPLFRPAAAGFAALALLSGVACSSRTEPQLGARTEDATATSGSSQPSNNSTSPAQTTAPSATQASLSTDLSVADLVQLTEEAVVRIETNSGVGTGFIVDDDGHIVTNNHVITGNTGRISTAIEVTLSDGTVLDATVVGADPRSDLAVLRVALPFEVRPLVLGSLADTVVGQDVVAIGFALDLKLGEGPSFSVTRGIISAKNRGIEESSTILGAIQTDAAITHGNSGGPLLNLKGEVVGVNTAIAPNNTGTGAAAGIGFAVGVDTVKAVYEEILQKGGVERALLGISNFVSIRPAQARELGMPDDVGGILLSVTTDGAAAAGLQSGDVITKIEDMEIRTESELAVAMIEADPGDVVTVEFYRDGEVQTVEVTLGTPVS